MARLTDEEHRALTAEKMAAVEVVVAHEVAGLVSGEDWRQFLDHQARFYDLDARNVLLVFAQHRHAYEQGRVPDPVPAHVAGLDTWKALGRDVERGQRGYTIVTHRGARVRDSHDVSGRTRTPHRSAWPRAGRAARRDAGLWGARLETVFALSQTAGRRLAASAHLTLRAGEVPPGLGEAVLHLIENRGWEVSSVPDATWVDGADGRTYYAGRFVTVRADLDDAAMVKTLVHQAAHVVLHGGPRGRYLAQAVKEVEAESVAYVVAAVHGMPAGGDRFAEVAAWASESANPADRDRAVLETQARIGKAAKAIIAVSPAEHEPGSRPPGADLALAAMGQIDSATRLAELLERMAPRDEMPSPGADGPEVA